MLDGIFRPASSGAHTGFLLEKFRILGRQVHFIDSTCHVVIRQIVGMRPRDTFVGLGLRIMCQILSETFERLPAPGNLHNHCGSLSMSARISWSSGSRSE